MTHRCAARAPQSALETALAALSGIKELPEPRSLITLEQGLVTMQAREAGKRCHHQAGDLACRRPPHAGTPATHTLHGPPDERFHAQLPPVQMMSERGRLTRPAHISAVIGRLLGDGKQRDLANQARAGASAGWGRWPWHCLGGAAFDCPPGSLMRPAGCN